MRILGPLRLCGVAGDAALGGDKPRRLLAALVLCANEVVSTGRLTLVIWGDSPPRSAKENLQTYVWSLRRALKAAGTPGLFIEARPPGYALRIEPEELDWLCFTRLAAAADECLDSDPATASKLLREALSYWHGAVLADVADDLSLLRPRIAAMEEARLRALEQRIQAELAAGSHLRLLGELSELVASHPLRERFRAHQMLALYRCERQAEALAAFHDLRAQLAEELGIEPAPDLGRLYEAILRADPGLSFTADSSTRATRSAHRIPRQLPALASGFTGRDEPLRELDGILAARSDSMAVVAVTGAPGVGKTSLALAWAHRVQQRFPGGTLFADLRGYDSSGSPTEPSEVLAEFLRALSIRPDEVPRGLAARAALFRTTVQGVKALVVLDNAASARQVRPLLPGAPGSLVLVTSRSRLSGLAARDGALHLALGPLQEAEAIALLRQTVDPSRVAAEPGPAADVSRLCGGLPLALRIAAERAAADPAMSLSALAAQLSTERLRVLTTDDNDTAVRAAFSWSYRGLVPPAARMFRLLGLHPGREFSVPAAAAVAGTGVSRARRLLVTLASSHLAEKAGQDRFRLHDLLAVYAAERAAADEPEAARQAAVGRVLTWYLHSADAADRVLLPQRRHLVLESPAQPRSLPAWAGHEEALGWCDLERANLAAAARLASEAGHAAIAWQIPAAMWSYHNLRNSWEECIATGNIGLAAARCADDRHGESLLLNCLGTAHADLGNLEQAVECFRRLIGIRVETGDRNGECSGLINLGLASFRLRRFGDAIRYYQSALTIAREICDRYMEGIAMVNLGETYRGMRQLTDAHQWLSAALTVVRQIGDRYCEAETLHQLGETHRDLGQPRPAADSLTRAAAICREIGHHAGEATALDSLGDLRHVQGDNGAAEHAWRRALTLYAELGDPRAHRVRARLDAAGSADPPL